MIKAVIFDCFGVLIDRGVNIELFEYIDQELKSKYKVGLLSNIYSGELEKLFTGEQLKPFDVVVASVEVGIAKPDPEIFKYTSRKLYLEPKECLMVDDQEIHCNGAKQAGMEAILYQNFPQFKAALEKMVAGQNA